MKTTYTATFIPTEDGTGYYCRVPDLPGCITTGETLDECVKLIEDAANLWLVGDEDTAPPPTPQNELEIPEGAIITLVPIDTLAYRAKMDSRAVQKAVSLPAWMANMAAEKNINCSKVLQESLMAIMD